MLQENLQRVSVVEKTTTHKLPAMGDFDLTTGNNGVVAHFNDGRAEFVIQNIAACLLQGEKAGNLIRLQSGKHELLLSPQVYEKLIVAAAEHIHALTSPDLTVPKEANTFTKLRAIWRNYSYKKITELQPALKFLRTHSERNRGGDTSAFIQRAEQYENDLKDIEHSSGAPIILAKEQIALRQQQQITIIVTNNPAAASFDEKDNVILVFNPSVTTDKVITVRRAKSGATYARTTGEEVLVPAAGLKIYSQSGENPVRLKIVEDSDLLEITTKFDEFLGRLGTDRAVMRLTQEVDEITIVAALSHQLARMTGEVAAQLQRAEQEADHNRQVNVVLTQAVIALGGLLGLGAAAIAQAPELAIGAVGAEVLIQAWLQNIKARSSEEAGVLAMGELLANTDVLEEIADLEQTLRRIQSLSEQRRERLQASPNSWTTNNNNDYGAATGENTQTY